MNLQDYINSKITGKQPKIPADTCSKWNQRNGAMFAAQGEGGAVMYFSQFAKTAAAPKLIDLARLAWQEGYCEFAAFFFRKAAQKEGITLEVSDAGNPNPDPGKKIAMAIAEVQIATSRVADHPGFPSLFQPGKFSPMQPVDARNDRAHYISAPSYWCQPKIDDNKCVVFATPDQVFYKSRTGKLNGMLDIQMDNALRNAARNLGNFVLEGEVTYLDAEGKEHCTASQATTANMDLGRADCLPVMTYVVFSCVWQDKAMLRMYGDMVDQGRKIVTYIQDIYGCRRIQPIVTAKTADEKCDLALRQRVEGREGEIWFKPNMEYRAGKHNDESFVRTKYCVEFEALCVGFTDTTAENHAFGAMRITSLDGKDLGLVGTGFTRDDKRQLYDRFFAEGAFKVTILSQGFTEGPESKAWHARYVGVVE